MGLFQGSFWGIKESILILEGLIFDRPDEAFYRCRVYGRRDSVRKAVLLRPVCPTDIDPPRTPSTRTASR